MSKDSADILRSQSCTDPTCSEAPYFHVHYKDNGTPEKETLRACPCLYTGPCVSDCTCVSPGSSRGCKRCCTYGSLEQRTAKAKFIAKIIDDEYQRLSKEKENK